MINYEVCQINTETGNIKGNFSKIEKCINESKADIIIFPEMAFTGYCLGALFDNIDFIIEQQDCLDKIQDILKKSSEKIVIIGHISYRGMRRSGFPRLYNSVSCIQYNKIQTYDKQLLANAEHHEDRKYFLEGEGTKIFDVETIYGKKIKIGCPVCEDVWYVDHHRNIPEEMVNMGAEILIIPNQSYFYYGKQEKRKELFSNIAKYNNVPVISVNSVGIGDIVKNIMIFDGGSLSFNRYGEMISEFPQFEEKNDIIDFEVNIEQNKKGKYEEILQALIFGQREHFRQVGFKTAQIHMSGGLDSSIVGAIAVLSLGKENVVFITNPSSINSSKTINNAKHSAEKLGVKLWINPIQEIVDTILKVDAESFIGKLSKPAISSLHASLRCTLGMYNSHRFNSAFVSTTNHTEMALGYSGYLDITFAGLHCLLGDISKIELYEFAEYLNQVIFKDDVIPRNLYNGEIEPSAELPDNTGADPIDYKIQSGLCCEIIRKHKSKRQLINDFIQKKLTKDYFPILPKLYGENDVYDSYTLEEFKREIDYSFNGKIKSYPGLRKSVYKAAQGPPNFIISPRSRGFSDRETLLNFYV